MTTAPRVGFVGLGHQGAPMARRIVDAGFATTLWARRPASLEAFATTGARFTETRRALGAVSDILCVCVVDDRGVDDVLRGPDGVLAAMPAGGIVVVHSTIHPDTCRRLADDFPHLHVLDAPVSGGGARAADGQLLVMVGGDTETLERARPVLDTFANPLLHLGPLGAGQEAKLLNNALFAAALALAADVHAIGRDRGLDPGSLAAVLAHGSGRSYAADLVASLGYDLSVMAPSAGPLLAKDVGILADLLHAGGKPDTQLLITVADAALDAMDYGHARRKDLR